MESTSYIIKKSWQIKKMLKKRGDGIAWYFDGKPFIVMFPTIGDHTSPLAGGVSQLESNGDQLVAEVSSTAPCKLYPYSILIMDPDEPDTVIGENSPPEMEVQQ